MTRYTAVLMLILFLCAGCTKPQPVAVVPDGDDGKEATGPVLQGLTAAERERFYHLDQSLKATLQSPSNVIAFLHRVLEQKGAKDRLAAVRPHAAKILDAFPDLDAMKKGSKLEQALAARIEALHQKVLDAPTPDLHSGL